MLLLDTNGRLASYACWRPGKPSDSLLIAGRSLRLRLRLLHQGCRAAARRPGQLDRQGPGLQAAAEAPAEPQDGGGYAEARGRPGEDC